jgi:hypothetical protein
MPFAQSCCGFAGLILAAALPFLAGCGESSATKPIAPPPVVSHHHDGPHGGAVTTLGPDHVEFIYENSPARLLVYVLGADANSPRPLPVTELSAQLKTADAAAFQPLTLAPLPLEGESAERSSRFAATQELSGAFEIVLRRSDSGKTYRAQALLEPVAIAATSFTCPMNCDSEKTYAAPGNCPVCHMTLVASRLGTREHADHRPRHGGVFFMSADNWHHLEGVFAPPGEFRLYLYDNFTRPLSAATFTANAEFQRTDKSNASVKMLPGAGDAFLTARMPADGIKPPLIAVRVQFKSGVDPELFNFSFAPPPAVPPAQ